LTAAFRDLDVQGGPLEVVRADGPGGEAGWQWVEGGGHDVQGGKKVGWKMLDEQDVAGAGQSGVMQGL
jgi:hypothetical protein